MSKTYEYVPEPALVKGNHNFADITAMVTDISLRPTPKPWYIAFGIANLLLLVLLVSVGYLFWEGTGIWGLNQPVGWGWAIINFVWWVGIGHAGTLISAILFLFRQGWRTAINRFAEAMTIFAVMCAGLFPAIHVGRIWVVYWMFPLPNSMALWPNFNSPLLWDVFAVATLMLLEPDAEVVRTRDKNTIISADYVVDVGLEYDPSKKRFDHHQTGGAGVRENGIQYASFGLVWKEYGEALAGGKREALIIDRKLAQPLDAHDNGMPIAEYNYEGLREYSIIDFLYSYLNKPEQTESDLFEIFMEVVSVAKDLLKREIDKAKESVRSFDAVINLYKSAEDKRIIIMDKEYEWQEALMSVPEPVFAVYPRNDGSWGVKCVPALTWCGAY